MFLRSFSPFFPFPVKGCRTAAAECLGLLRHLLPVPGRRPADVASSRTPGGASVPAKFV